jgi:hypothetical protein
VNTTNSTASAVLNDEDDDATDYGSDPDVDPNEPIGDIDLEIVGLCSSTNGRSCTVHKACGLSVVVGDILRLKETVVTISGKTEKAVKLVKIADGTEACTVAYLPRMVLNTPTVRRNINNFCIVKELYCKSKSAFIRQKSYRNLGMAGVVLLNEIPRQT